MPICAGPGRGPVVTGASRTTYDTVDLTSILQSIRNKSSENSYGNNNVTVIGLQGFFDNGGSSAGIVFELSSVKSSGPAEVLLATNSSWMTFEATAYFGPSTSTSGSYDQPRENINGGLEQSGWATPAFVVGKAWVNGVVHAQAVSSTIVAKSTDALMIESGVKPAVVRSVTKNSHFIDFGSEMMGGVTLAVKVSAAGDDGAVTDDAAAAGSCQLILGKF